MNELCAQCGYSLSGLPANARCPECGHPCRPLDVSPEAAARMLTGFRCLIAAPILFVAWLAVVLCLGIFNLLLAYGSEPLWPGWVQTVLGAAIAVPFFVALVGWWAALVPDPNREAGIRRLGRIIGRWLALLGCLTIVAAISWYEFVSATDVFRAALMCGLLTMGLGMASGLVYLRELVRASDIPHASRSVKLAYTLSLIQLPLLAAIWLILAAPQGGARDMLLDVAAILECAVVGFMALSSFRTIRLLAGALIRDIERARGSQWCAADLDFVP